MKRVDLLQVIKKYKPTLQKNNKGNPFPKLILYTQLTRLQKTFLSFLEEPKKIPLVDSSIIINGIPLIPILIEAQLVIKLTKALSR